eukprot:symbB.v1.2.040486.t1/scaffold7273.1/size13844/3
MCSSVLCLILATVLEKLGLPESAGEEIIVYGQFYLPLSAVYWIMKKNFLDIPETELFEVFQHHRFSTMCGER